MPLFKRESISWGILVIEMAAIMISVVLGFTLNEWRHSRAEMGAVRTAEQSIIRELKHNLAQTEHRQTYFQEFQDTLAVLADRYGIEMAIDPDTIGFHNFPAYQYRTGAYDAARASGALSNMDFETMEVIMQTYGTQEFHQVQSWTLAEWHFDGRWETVQHYLRSNTSMLQPELPYLQELALRVLQGEEREAVEQELENRDLAAARR